MKSASRFFDGKISISWNLSSVGEKGVRYLSIHENQDRCILRRLYLIFKLPVVAARRQTAAD
jgi:hypothetical protein